MSDRMIPQRKKSATSSFTTSSLSSPVTSTLASPIRNFNLQLDTASAQKTQESSTLQEEQPKSEQSSESEKLQKPLSHDISRISLRPQTRITVNQPGDIYEQEADLMAQRVMRTPTPQAIASSDNSAAQDILQRKCIACEKEDEENSQKFPIMPLLQREVSSDRSKVNDNLGNFSRPKSSAMPSAGVAIAKK
jgi:hypothetical protein